MKPLPRLLPLCALFAIALACPLSLLPPRACAWQAEADRQTLVELRARAEQGEVQSQLVLALAFAWGKIGLATNHTEAVKWLRKAAEQNLAAAQFNPGICYERGDGVAKYEVEAYK